MEQITFNTNNEPYYSEEFIKGFKCGAQRQFEADKADRPEGKWIRDDVGTLICSECKRPRRDSRIGHTNFCNSCGADMRDVEI